MPHDSASSFGAAQIWGSSLWSLRELMGKEKANSIVGNTWVQWQPLQANNVYQNFCEEILKMMQDNEKQFYKSSVSVLKESNLMK